MLSPRHSASAVLFGRLVVIFGGLGTVGYLADLHTFDLDARVLSRTAPDGPAARARPIMFASSSAVFVCGGHSTRSKNDLHSFHFATSRWRALADMDGRHSVGTSFCSGGPDTHFIFGGGAKLARFSPVSGKFTRVATSGGGPDRHLTGLSMAAGRSFLFVFGGGRASALWGLDLRSLTWAPIFVAPDNRSVSPADGSVTAAGALELARASGETMVYSWKDTALWRVLGAECIGWSPVHRLAVGQAVAALNHTADMIALLREF
jgi:hypothetical protein